MVMNTFFEKQLGRIRAIRWSEIGKTVDDNHCKLVRKFLYSILESDGMTGSKNPHFEPRKQISDEVTVCDSIRAEVVSLTDSFYVRLIILRHLQICKLADFGNSVALNLVNLYDPLVEVIENGGSLDLDEQMNIVVDGTWTAPARNLEYLSP